MHARYWLVRCAIGPLCSAASEVLQGQPRTRMGCLHGGGNSLRTNRVYLLEFSKQHAAERQEPDALVNIFLGQALTPLHLTQPVAEFIHVFSYSLNEILDLISIFPSNRHLKHFPLYGGYPANRPTPENRTADCVKQRKETVKMGKDLPERRRFPSRRGEGGKPAGRRKSANQPTFSHGPFRFSVDPEKSSTRPRRYRRSGAFPDRRRS